MSHSFSTGSFVMDQERTRPMLDFLWLGYCFESYFGDKKGIQNDYTQPHINISCCDSWCHYIYS